MWQKTTQGLYKKFVFHDFKEAFSFMNKVADVCEELGHHPKWQNEWNEVEIWLRTHSAEDAITDKDRQLAAKIDEIFSTFPVS